MNEEIEVKIDKKKKLLAVLAVFLVAGLVAWFCVPELEEEMEGLN